MSALLLTHVKFFNSAMVGKAPSEKNYRLAVGIPGIVALIALAFSPVISSVNDPEFGQPNFHQQQR
jgi:hypothetical protein